MNKFISSFEKGQAAADEAKKNRNEISLLFEELNDELSVATNGNVKIEIHEREEKVGIEQLVRFNFVAPRYDAICALNPSVHDSPVKELAVWTQSKLGYPCTLKIGKFTISCDDLAALESALSDMLSDPQVGESLQKLMEL